MGSLHGSAKGCSVPDVSLSFSYFQDPLTGRITRFDQFVAPEAARLTPEAEPDAPTAVPMSGGAEPAGAANHHD